MKVTEKSFKLIIPLVICFLIVIFPFLNQYLLSVLTILFIYQILSVSWNLLAGYTGQFSFGHHAFYAIGAYSSALLVLHLGIPIPIGIIIGALIAGVIGFLLSVLCLRVRGFYLALVTWGFAEIVRMILIMEYDVTRGLLGLSVPRLFAGMGNLPHCYLALGLFIVTAICCYKILNSNVGLYIRAIRDDEDVAEFMGVDTVKMKCIISTIASLFAGIAGGIYAHFMGIITPLLSEFTTMGMILYMVILGGFGTFLGPIVGGAVVVLIWEFFRGFATLWMIIFALIIIVILKFAPEGLVGLIRGLILKYVSNENVRKIAERVLK
jgi:branched-chain amino acid transport system permease protein